MDKADQRDFDSHYEYWDKIKGGEMVKDRTKERIQRIRELAVDLGEDTATCVGLTEETLRADCSDCSSFVLCEQVFLEEKEAVDSK